MNIKDRNIFLRLLILFFGLILIAAIAEAIKLALKQFAGLTIGGAVPALLVYGLPLVVLMSWLGFFGKKDAKNNEPAPRPSPEKWTE